MPQLELDPTKCTDVDIPENDLIGWFRGGALLASAPERAQRLLSPMLFDAGFDLARPIHIHQHEGASGVALYQNQGQTKGDGADHRAGRRAMVAPSAVGAALRSVAVGPR